MMKNQEENKKRNNGFDSMDFIYFLIADLIRPVDLAIHISLTHKESVVASIFEA